MKKLKLSKNKFALVDDEDYEFLSIFKWSLNGMGRAFRQEKSTLKQIYLHRQIMKAPDNLTVDHIDGNPLNNQRKNLRLCTQQDNLKNKKLYKNSTTGYKGAYKNNGKYNSIISVEGKLIYLGRFNTPLEAHMEYIKAAKKYYGVFASRSY